MSLVYSSVRIKEENELPNYIQTLISAFPIIPSKVLAEVVTRYLINKNT
jgi:hypothetical protein